MEKCIVTFGELLLRLAPPGYTRFVQTDTFNAVYGGGEANVAVSCATTGLMHGLSRSFQTMISDRLP